MSQPIEVDTGRTSQFALERALRPQRVILGVVALALVLAGSRSGPVPLGQDLRIIVGVLAVANVLWNVVRPKSTELTAGFALGSVVQIGVDIVLALASIVALDSQATPLAWILLFVPVLDAAAQSGLRGAVSVWAGVSLTYVAVLLSIEGGEASNAASLQTGVQQVVALLAVAIPTVIVTGRLRGDLDATGEARAEADDHVYRMRAVSSVAQQLSSASDPGQVLALAADAVLQLGFVRADICTRVIDEPWVTEHAAGRPGAFDAASDALLSAAIQNCSKASIGVGETPAEDLQRLYDAGYRSALAVVVKTSDNQWIGIRAYSDSQLTSVDGLWESLETLISLIGAAWTNRVDHRNLSVLARKMEHEATHDSLTGIPNRNQLLRDLDQAITHEVSDLAVLFMDLDGFKAINDSWGHDAGDRALIEIARRLTTLVGSSGRAARLGGDEFVAFSIRRDISVLEPLVKEIIASVSAPIDVGPATTTVGVSIGVAFWTNEENVSTLMRRADEAMYAAKVEGRATKMSNYRFAQSDDRMSLPQ